MDLKQCVFKCLQSLCFFPLASVENVCHVLKMWNMITAILLKGLSSSHLLVSGVVIRDVADRYLVLLSAFLHVVLTFGHLILQLPHLKHWELVVCRLLANNCTRCKLCVGAITKFALGATHEWVIGAGAAICVKSRDWGNISYHPTPAHLVTTPCPKSALLQLDDSQQLCRIVWRCE